MAALGGELARLAGPVRAVAGTGVRAQIDLLTQLMAGADAGERRRAALAAYAGMVGALVLARAVDDSALAEEILGAVRAGAVQTGAQGPG